MDYNQQQNTNGYNNWTGLNYYHVQLHIYVFLYVYMYTITASNTQTFKSYIDYSKLYYTNLTIDYLTFNNQRALDEEI